MSELTINQKNQALKIVLLLYVIVLIGILIGIIFKPKIYSNKTVQYKIDLPEEISLAKTNDTLYINKITKDSIYLGFKPNK